VAAIVVQSAENSPAGLAALSRYPRIVVCAGPKAICDPR
jgi:hypothetical protein